MTDMLELADFEYRARDLVDRLALALPRGLDLQAIVDRARPR